MIVRVLIYGLLGWVIEIIWTGTGSLLARDPTLTSQTYLWMFPIYSFAAIVLESVHSFLRETVWIFRGIVYMFIIFAIEYSSGWLLQEVVGVCPWYYTTEMAINGFIRLDYAPAWFIAGLTFEKVHDFLKENITT